MTETATQSPAQSAQPTQPALPLAELQALVAEFIEAAQATTKTFMAERFPTLPVPAFSAEYGSKYVRIVKADSASDRRSASVYCFVEVATGKVAKAEGWKKPARKADGSLQSQYSLADPESKALLFSRLDPYGGVFYVGAHK